MLKFAIYVFEYRCGSNDVIIPDTPPIEGAFIETKMVTGREQVYFDKKVKAVLDSQGNPVLAYDKEAREPSHNFRNWYTNHRREGDYWIGDKEERNWFIEFVDAQTFVDVMTEVCKRESASIDLGDCVIRINE